MRVSGQLISCVLIAIIATAVPVARADCAAPSVRRVIRFYEYAGLQTNDAAANFSIFRSVVDQEVARLNTPHGEANHTNPLTTEPRSGSSGNYARGQLDPGVSVQVMNADPRLLELLSGYVQRNAQRDLYIVHSEIYMLPVSGAGSIQPISEDFLLDPSEYDKARSVHLAATYYALAVDAGLRSCRPEQVAFLSKAAETLQDVQPISGVGMKSLAALIRAAQTALGVPQ
jgi:hypothetical protein